MTQKERQARSRGEILRAAMEEFGNRGYDQVTMERICTVHGISKGMMYHYYSNKDELFLLCVQATFQELTDHIRQGTEGLPAENTLEAIKGFFLLREEFFRTHPQQKTIFENAMVHPPKHLREQIQELRGPIREVNRQFLERVVAQAKLRPGLRPEQVARYLESMQDTFRGAVLRCQEESGKEDLHTMLELSGELLEMILFGVVQQPEREG